MKASETIGHFNPVWAWVGHDEPNYVYSDEGRDLAEKLSALSSYPVHDRTHNLLTSGDGTPSLKWGSTNAFSRDASGKAVYNWAILDKIFDTYKAAGIAPFVEIGFTPEALSTHPEPYQHHWPKDFATGWSYPPKSYDEWCDLVYHWVRHMAERYGTDDVAKWEWEIWNEPDIFYWHGSVEDYSKLYDYTVAAVRKALPNARVGGPASTGPASERAAEFLRAFLDHCARGTNHVTGQRGVPLDFISFHAKGKARVTDGHLELSIGTHLKDIDRGFAIIEGFPEFRHLPVVLSESDPESCAACDATSHPEDAYRLTSQYASYEAELINASLALAQKHRINLEGSIAWAFTFPGQPVFAGLRSLTTHEIDLPLLNVFRMFGQMRGDRLDAESTGAADLNSLVELTAQSRSDVGVIATRDSHKINVLIWNYKDEAVGVPAATIRLTLTGLPQGVSRMLLEHWRVDHDHSNAYAAFERMGSPQAPSDTQYEELKRAGQLQLLGSPRWMTVKDDTIELTFTEPLQGVSLLGFTW